MPDQTEPDLTRLVEASVAGDSSARERLLAAVYDDLRKIASARFGVGRPGDTLQPTALVNETVIELLRRLDQPQRLALASREQFFAAVAMAMRTILRDHWRARNALKRGGGDRPAPLIADPVSPSSDDPFAAIDYLALDEALDRLENYDLRWHRVVMHRFFAARTIEETADMLGMGVTAVQADWRFARAWLLREIRGMQA
ncbi:MAG: ECF-type sigma factor [Phycisphaerales bacterium]